MWGLFGVEGRYEFVREGGEGGEGEELRGCCLLFAMVVVMVVVMAVVSLLLPFYACV